METLTKCFAKICSKDQSKPTLLHSTTQLSRSYINLPRSSISNAEHLGSSHLLRNRMLKQPITSSYFVSGHAKVLRNSESGETEMQRTERSKTVHVKLQLQKECSFGENFLLVGSDPILGMWDASGAIPLTWSEGHLWMVEMDLPIDLSIHFKFILQQSSGDLLWQSGPNRTFQTRETNNTLVITEDWDNAKFQKISEEQIISENEDSLINRGFEPTVEMTTKDEITAKDRAMCKEEESTLPNENQISDAEMWLDEEGPVLVPGMKPLPTEMGAEKSLPTDLGKTISPGTSPRFAADDHNIPEAEATS